MSFTREEGADAIIFLALVTGTIVSWEDAMQKWELSDEHERRQIEFMYERYGRSA